MGRKGWILLAVCVAVILVAAIFYVQSRRAGWAVWKAQPQADSSALVPPAETGGTQAVQNPTAASGHDGRVMTYKVRRGDTLGAISRRFLGNSAKWRAIAKENGIRGSTIKAGMELRITLASAN